MLQHLPFWGRVSKNGMPGPMGQSEPAPTNVSIHGWMDGWMVHGQDNFFSLGYCSQANLPIAKGSSNWTASKQENWGGWCGVSGCSVTLGHSYEHLAFLDVLKVFSFLEVISF